MMFAYISRFSGWFRIPQGGRRFNHLSSVCLKLSQTGHDRPLVNIGRSCVSLDHGRPGIPLSLPKLFGCPPRS